MVCADRMESKAVGVGIEAGVGEEGEVEGVWVGMGNGEQVLVETVGLQRNVHLTMGVIMMVVRVVMILKGVEVVGEAMVNGLW